MGEPTPEPRPRVDCTRYFDHLYFCYTPTWQLTQLYRRGELDSCEGAFHDWLDCLLIKAKPNPEVEARLTGKAAKPCIWRLRTPEEAAAFWREAEFPQVVGTAAEEKKL